MKKSRQLKMTALNQKEEIGLEFWFVNICSTSSLKNSKKEPFKLKRHSMKIFEFMRN